MQPEADSRLASLLRAFRFSHRWSLARYAVAGVLISLGYTATVIALVEAIPSLSPSWASIVSFVLWTPVSYFSHRDFTFRADRRRSLHAALKFAVTFALRFVVAGVAVFVFTDYLHLHYLLGVLANWIVLPAISYAVMRFWVFEGWEADEASAKASANAKRAA